MAHTGLHCSTTGTTILCEYTGSSSSTQLPVRDIPIFDYRWQPGLLSFYLFRLPFLKPLFHFASTFFVTNVDRSDHFDIRSGT
jgi:hypothetical protein